MVHFWPLTGEVAEWFKARAWKARGAQALAGSNPVFSAMIQEDGWEPSDCIIISR